MKNSEIARIFYEIADILEMQGVEWRPNAYRKAARSLEILQKDVGDIYSETGIKGLLEISSIGKNLSKKIEEYLTTGKIKEYEKIKKSIPSGVEELMHIQCVGPKKAFKLYKELGIKNTNQLEEYAKKGKIRFLAGFGEQSEKDIISGIELIKKGNERALLGIALQTARDMEEYLRKVPGVMSINVAGSLRRRKETVKDIDILATAKNSEKLMNAFTIMPNVDRILAKGKTKSAVILKEGLNADVRAVPQKSYGAAMQYFTGSKEHNILLRQLAMKKGLKLNEYGLFNIKKGNQIAGRTEEEVYKKLGLKYIEPELRENTGELQTRKLPKLIGYTAIKGDLHIHTKWSDGLNTTEEMIQSAINLSYEYIAITDHSKSQHIAGGLDEKELFKHIAEIDKLQKKYPQIRIFKGSEVDILSDGEMDYTDKILAQLDIVIASVHSGFKAAKEEMTKRVLRALDNKYVSILAHPTGRLINQRNQYEIDMQKIIEKAKERKIALEINSQPSRLDLNDANARTAVQSGAKLCINTDSHTKESFQSIDLGIAQARRGWVEGKDVINALRLKKIEKWIER